MSNLVSPVRAAEHFGVSKSFIYKLKSLGEINFYYLASKPFVNLDEVNSKILTTTKSN